MSSSRTSSRIPSLDGLRALAIAFVVLSHLSGTRGFAHLPSRLSGTLAGLGVRVFFVISGFLITSLLLAEQSRTGTISLRAFYFRRTMRIFPPFYALVIAMALADALGWIALRPFDLLAALTYTTNYHHDRAWYLGHAWSLAVEEQFYLLWPFVLAYLGPRRAAQVALGTLVASPLLRVVLLIAAPTFRAGIGETFPTVADAMATGCLLAHHRERLATCSRWLVFSGRRAFWLLPGLGLLAACSPSAKVNVLIGQTITNLTIAALIERVVRLPDRGFGTFLNARPVVFAGALSYSLYLWQQPFLNRRSPASLAHFPINLLAALACAALSYFLIEASALRLRDRLAQTSRRPARPAPAA